MSESLQGIRQAKEGASKVAFKSSTLENVVDAATSVSQIEEPIDWKTKHKQASNRKKKSNVPSSVPSDFTNYTSGASSYKDKGKRRRRNRKCDSNVAVDFIKYLLIGSPFFRCTESDDSDQEDDNKRPSTDNTDVEKALESLKLTQTSSSNSKIEKKRRINLRKISKNFLERGKNVKQTLSDMKNHLADNIVDVVDEGYGYDSNVTDWKKFTVHRYNRGNVSRVVM